MDMAFVNVLTSDVGVLINNGTNGSINFANVINYSLIGTPAVQTLANADVNGDKVLDLVIPANVSGQGAVMILPGVGDGTFSTANGSQVLVQNNPSWVAVGDVNGDGIPDLAVSIDDQTNGNGIAIVLGTGNGAFGTSTLFPSTSQAGNSGPGTLVISDVNGDGLPDVIFDNQWFGTEGILYSAGSGNFSGPVEFPGSALNNGLVLADVNGDGALDLVTGGGFSGVTVLLNAASASTGTTPSTTTLVSSLNPAIAGQTVTLNATWLPVPVAQLIFRPAASRLTTGRQPWDRQRSTQVVLHRSPLHRWRLARTTSSRATAATATSLPAPSRL